jgi:Tol biopolymer transport system component
MKLLATISIFACFLSAFAIRAERRSFIGAPAPSDSSLYITLNSSILSAPMTRPQFKPIFYSAFPCRSPMPSANDSLIAYLSFRNLSEEIYIYDATQIAERRLSFSYGDYGRFNSKKLLKWSDDAKMILYLENDPYYNDNRKAIKSVDIQSGEIKTVFEGEIFDADIDVNKSTICYSLIDTYLEKARPMGLFIYDFKNDSSFRIAEDSMLCYSPIIRNNSVFFLSNYLGYKNVFKFDTDNKTIVQISAFIDFDVNNIRFGANKLTIEKNGEIYLCDLDGKNLNKIPTDNIELKKLDNPTENATKPLFANFDISKDGKFIASAEHGVLRIDALDGANSYSSQNETKSFYRLVRISDDSKYVAYCRDSLQYSILEMIDNDGSDKIEIIRSNERIINYKLSSDSRYLVYSAINDKTYLYDFVSRKSILIDSGSTSAQTSFDFSPKSSFICLNKLGDRLISELYLYEIEKKKLNKVSDNSNNLYYPVFSDDSKYLYFVEKQGENFILKGAPLNIEIKSPTFIADSRAHGKDMDDIEEEVSDKDKPSKKKKVKSGKKVESSDEVIDLINMRYSSFIICESPDTIYNLQSSNHYLYFQRGDNEFFKWNSHNSELQRIGEYLDYKCSDNSKIVALDNNFDLRVLNRAQNERLCNLLNKNERTDYNTLLRLIIDAIYNKLDENKIKLIQSAADLDMKNLYDIYYFLDENHTDAVLSNDYFDYSQSERTGLLDMPIEYDPTIKRLAIKQEANNSKTETNRSIEIDGATIQNYLDYYKALLNKSGKYVKLKYQTGNNNREDLLKVSENYEFKQIQNSFKEFKAQFKSYPNILYQSTYNGIDNSIISNRDKYIIDLRFSDFKLFDKDIIYRNVAKFIALLSRMQAKYYFIIDSKTSRQTLNILSAIGAEPQIELLLVGLCPIEPILKKFKNIRYFRNYIEAANYIKR